MPEMTAPKNVPAMRYEILAINRFKGVDMTSGVVNVDESRSPEAPNMMPDEDGYPKKRPGFATIESYSGGAVYGAYSLTVKDRVVHFVHVGGNLYADGALVYANMKAAYSVAVQLKQRLWILDGKTYLYAGLNASGEPECAPVSTIATVPTVAIGKDPAGQTGAASYQPVNMLTGWRKDSFKATTSTTVFVLSFNNLSAAAVKVTRLNVAQIVLLHSTLTSEYAVSSKNCHYFNSERG